MAKIVEYKEIPLDDLVIGKAQARTEAGKDIDELATSIEKQGLLQPIAVCESDIKGKWEILVGQRRFLAHKQLGKETIMAGVFDERMEGAQAKTISIAENLIRRKLSTQELREGIRLLYQEYNDVKILSDKTGFPMSVIKANLGYPRLIQPLKDLVDAEKVETDVAIKAQDASYDEEGEINEEAAIQLSHDMNSMTGVQRKRTLEIIKEGGGVSNTDGGIDDIVESAKSGKKVSQIVVTVTNNTKKALSEYARSKNMNQDSACVTLIEESLTSNGFLDS